MKKNQRSALLLMVLTILIDFTGFGLVIPLLPFWARHLGANDLEVGLIITLYAIAQFIFTPMLGALSDRYGRRPIILASLLIETIALVMSALAGTLPLLLLARFIGGIGGANIGSAQAVISDVTTSKERTKGMGFIGAAIGVGFVIGPALGGLLAPLGTSLVLLCAAGLALLNALLVFVLLPETNPREQTRNRGQDTKLKRRLIGSFSILWTGWQHAMQAPLVVRLVITNLIYTLAFTSMETILPLFTARQFHWGASQNGYLFAFVGIIVVIMQGGLVSRLVKRYTEQKVLLAGLVLLTIGLVTLAFSTQFALLLISIGIISVGDGAVSPTVSTLLSFASPGGYQGEMLGLSQGFSSLGRVIGPVIAGAISTRSNSSNALLCGGIIALIAVFAIAPTLTQFAAVSLRARDQASDSSLMDERQGEPTTSSKR